MSGTGFRSALAACAAARLSYALLGLRPPAGKHAWTRTNHRGEPITLLEGPAVAIGSVTGALLASGPDQREKIAMAVAGAGAAAFGGYDDLAGDGSSKGFRGHLGALRKGELTTGAVKIAGIGATSLTAALIAGKPGGHRGGQPGGHQAGQPAGRRSGLAGGRRSGLAGYDEAASGGQRGAGVLAAADTVINAGLVAGMANLLNLFDLRPGRAIKVAIGTGGMLAALPGRAGQASAAPVAAAVALLPEDLGERSMLGDSGANAIGAMLGVAAGTLPRPARVGLLGIVAGLTAASEVVSFTRVIERTGPLRWLDMLGRRPAAPPPGPAAAGGPAGTDPTATGRGGASPASTAAPSPGSARAAGRR